MQFPIGGSVEPSLYF